MGSVTANYGLLDFSASGEANPIIGLEGAGSRVLAAFGGDPLTSFLDQLTVDGLGDVTVTFTATLAGTSNVVHEPGERTSNPSDADFRNIVRVNYGLGNFVIDLTAPGTDTESAVITAANFATFGPISFSFFDGLFGDGDASSGDALGATSFNVSAESTLCVSVTGATTVSIASGATYCTGQPTTSAVPEPTSVALFGAPLVLWWWRRGRRSDASRKAA